MQENNVFVRCCNCDRYMTPYINGAYGSYWTEYLCECGNYVKEESITVTSNRTEFKGNGTTTTTTL